MKVCGKNMPEFECFYKIKEYLCIIKAWLYENKIDTKLSFVKLFGYILLFFARFCKYFRFY